MQKIYVLDTKVLLSDPMSIETGFEDNIVVITSETLQELQGFLSVPGEERAKAREVSIILDQMKEKGDLTEGVRNKAGGIFKVYACKKVRDILPSGFSPDKPENKLIVACILMAKSEELPVILVSNDEMMRVNTTVCAKYASAQLRVQSYKNIESESDYNGYTDIDISGDRIDDLYANKEIVIPDGLSLYENEFVTLHSGKQSALSIARKGMLHLVKEQSLYGGIKPLNYLQNYAIYALKADPEEIPLVCLLGPAGTSKTFLSLAAGLDETYAAAVGGESRYYKMLVSRPNNLTSDPGIGYLPGDMDEKMTPLLAPLYDNMESLLMEKGKIDRKQIQTHVEDIFSSIVEVTALSYIRGRTLRNTYVFCDEAQNASRNLIKDLITRAGDGTKIVLCGDPEQVDAPNLNARNNGLVYAVDTMKDSPYSAIIKFDANKSVRSSLAKDAIQRM